MPLIRTIQINEDTKVGIWKLSEPEPYFKNTFGIREKIAHPYKRLQHLAGRRLISILEPDLLLKDIQIADSGKPYLADGGYKFSISHSMDYVAAILSRHDKVGIDIEKITLKPRHIAHKFLNLQEQKRITPERTLKWFTLFWSAKEAVYKWAGQKGVNFKAHIHIQPFEAEKNGIITCCFQKGAVDQELQLYYRTNSEFVLVWVTSQ